MFAECSSLTGMQIPAVTVLEQYCYGQLFYYCTSLSSIEVSFTDWTQVSDMTTEWVKNVAANGTFTKPAALPEEYGINRIPSGWTVVNK